VIHCSMSPPLPLPVTSEQRHQLEKWVRARTTPQRLVQRAQILLLAADGHSDTAISRQLGLCRATVARWKQRFLAEGLTVLTYDQPRSGRPKSVLTAAKIKAIVDATRLTTPPGGTHWSSRSMAQAQGVSTSSVQRIWRAHHLQPHRIETFKLSLDPQFTEKLADVVGLYLAPPEKALVLCVDEKSQIQALERTQPVLPVREGLPARQTHDYTRHGTTSLFAALHVLEGKITGSCYARHTHAEFLQFLQQLETETPAGLHLHLILDNYATHKHAAVKTWLAAHPRFHLHFTPTSCSWSNLVERFFAALTTQRLRRGSFASVAELEAAIHGYIEHHNAHGKPYIWTASFEKIIRAINRCYPSSDSGH